jgi:hypothetical protein
MINNRYNPNKNTNSPYNAQRPGLPINRPGQRQPVSSTTSVNRTTPNRAAANRTTSNRSAPNRNTPNRSSANRLNPNRPVQNISNQKRTNDNKNSQPMPSSENMGKEGILKTNATKDKENTKKPNNIVDEKNTSYQEESSIKKPTNNLSNLLNLSNMDSKDILKGIIFSEILGKPKALRRGRW